MDRAAGIFADPAKVHRIDHAGPLLQVARAAQRRALAAAGPAILQAGTSGKGRDFAARYADAVFAIQPYLAGAKALYDDIKRGVVEAGPAAASACKMLFGVQPIIGASRAEAEDKQAEHNALVPLEGGLAILSGHLDFDLSTLPLDTIMAHRTEPKLQRMQTRYRSMTRRAADPAAGGAEPRPERRPAADGGHAQPTSPTSSRPISTRSAATASCSRRSIRRARSRNSSIWWCPELQRRGRFRREYAGTTQRDHLNQDDSGDLADRLALRRG